MQIADLPSALDAVATLAPAGSELALFLDYDGTLTPIVDRPDAAHLSEAMRATLRALAVRTPVVLVSGREREEVSRLVGLDQLGAVGSHGFDIRGPAGSALRHEVATDALPLLDRAETELRARLKTIPGALLERKRFGIAAHYRMADAAGAEQIRAAIRTVAAATKGLRLSQGKMVLELRPDVDWDKGRAVLWLLEKLGWEKRRPIHIGDDATDETVFQALAERGVGIVVAAASEESRDTAASFRLRDPDEVREFLDRVTARDE
ncbi:MAG: trehalose-phosphatase [Deltaproteobacteria bacterium]